MPGPRLFLAQRLSAALMAPLVVAHLIGILYAVHGGLDAAEILSRTRGNLLLGALYLLFVLAAAVHAAIGVRVVAHEWARLRGPALDLLTGLCGLLLLVMGGYAVFAVVLP